MTILDTAIWRLRDVHLSVLDGASLGTVLDRAAGRTV
jgi:hypothetical protein